MPGECPIGFYVFELSYFDYRTLLSVLDILGLLLFAAVATAEFA